MKHVNFYLKKPPTGAEVMQALSVIQPYSRKHRQPGKSLKQAYMDTLWEAWMSRDEDALQVLGNCVTVLESHMLDSKVQVHARCLLYQPPRLN